MGRVYLWLEGELLLCLLLKCFELLLLFLFENLGPLKKVDVAIVVLVTLRYDIVGSGVDLWMKSMVTFGFRLYLLLLMLHLQLLLKLPLLLMLKEFSNISLLPCAIYLGLKCWLILVRVLPECLLINLRLLYRVLDLLITDDLFVPLMNRHMSVLFPLDYLLCLPIDLWLLSEFFELPLGTEKLNPFLELLPPCGIIEEPLHSRVEYSLCHTGGVESSGSEAIKAVRREIVIEWRIIMQERV